MSLVSPQMAASVGREIARRVSHPICASDIRRWAIAVYWPGTPPAELTTSIDGSPLIAPEEFNPFAWSCASASPSDALVDEGPQLDHALNGGLEVTYGAPMRVGEVITSVQTLVGHDERRTRLGPTLISRFEDAWTNDSGDLVKTQVMTVLRY